MFFYVDWICERKNCFFINHISPWVKNITSYSNDFKVSFVSSFSHSLHVQPIESSIPLDPLPERSLPPPPTPTGTLHVIRPILAASGLRRKRMN